MKSKRVKIWGLYSITSVLKWMGQQGWTVEEAEKVLEELAPGAVVRSTITTELSDGKNPNYNHNTAPITAAEADTLNQTRARVMGKASNDPDGQFASQLRSTAEHLFTQGYFNPADLADKRARTLQEVVQRRGQPKFRDDLIDAYGGRCAVTVCDAVAALEAAHISRYRGPQSDHVVNGLLLRADIHTLFDLDLLGVEPKSLEIALASPLEGTCYEDLKGKALCVPSDPGLHPNKDALAGRWKRFLEGQNGQPT